MFGSILIFDSPLCFELWPGSTALRVFDKLLLRIPLAIEDIVLSRWLFLPSVSTLSSNYCGEALRVVFLLGLSLDLICISSK